MHSRARAAGPGVESRAPCHPRRPRRRRAPRPALRRRASPAPRARAAGDVRIEGDVTYEPGTGPRPRRTERRLRRGAVVLRARSAHVGPGHAARSAPRAACSSPIRRASSPRTRSARSSAARGEAEGVVAFVKDQPVGSLRAATADEARPRRAQPAHLLGASGCAATRDGRLRLDGARLTLCDCPGGARAVVGGDARARRTSSREARDPVLAGPPRHAALPVRRPPGPGPRPARGSTCRSAIGSRGSSCRRSAPPARRGFGDRRSRSSHARPERRRDAHAGVRVRPRRTTSSKRQARGARARARGSSCAGRPAGGADGPARARLARTTSTASRGGEGGDRFALIGAHAQRLGAATTLARGAAARGRSGLGARHRRPTCSPGACRTARSDVLLSHRRDALVARGGRELPPAAPAAGIGASAHRRPRYGTFPPGRTGRSAPTWASRAAGARPRRRSCPIAAGPAPALRARRRRALRAARRASLDVARAAPATTRADARAEVALPAPPRRRAHARALRRAAPRSATRSTTARTRRASAWGVAGAVARRPRSRAASARSATRSRRASSGAPAPASPATRSRSPAYDAFDRTGSGLLSAARRARSSQLRAAVETRLDGRRRGRRSGSSSGRTATCAAGRFAETFAALAVAAGPFAADARARFFAVDGRAEPGHAAADPVVVSTGSPSSRAGVARPGPARRRASAPASSRSGPAARGRSSPASTRSSTSAARPLDAAASATAGARAAVGGARRSGTTRSFPGRAAFVRAARRPASARRALGRSSSTPRASPGSRPATASGSSPWSRG